MVSQLAGVVIGGAISEMRTNGKQVIYRFNGNPKDDEVVLDRMGTMPFRRVGEILTKNGKKWRVTVVRDDFNISAFKKTVPIHRVFLTDKL